MSKRSYLLFVVLSLILLANSALAQSEAAAQGTQSSTPVVAVSVSTEGARFTSPARVLEMRLGIYNAKGDLIFDSGARQGDTLDWRIKDVAQAMTDGTYLCVVTVKDFQGKLRQRLGHINMQSGHITLKRSRLEDLTAEQSQALANGRQSQKIDPAENNESFTVYGEGKSRAVVVTAHDGQDGQVSATSGALTFRTGDFFSNKAKEQMRITPEGRVGIGTDKPEAALDVAGTIRARGGIVFEDGTVLTSASAAKTAKTTITEATVTGVQTPLISANSTGTTNQVSKWLDSNGTLGNSTITEASGNVGIGTNNPAASLHVNGSFRVDNSNLTYFNTTLDTTKPLFMMGESGVHGFQVQRISPSAATKYYIVDYKGVGQIGFDFEGGSSYIMGNLGLGTGNPTAKLEVVGNLKVSGNGNGIMFPDGSIMTTASAGNGNLSGNSVVNAINDPATNVAISDSRLNGNIARLNGANAWTGANTFTSGLSANGAPISNVGNPVAVTDAANRGYVDSNFIKFNPGAPQVSVGDANGTSAMLNLRGGSTCCSGPGGFTPGDFKVYQNGSFLATGNLGIGTIPVEGQGYRTMWYTYKGAFRSGYAATEWDDANTGFFSWAGGSQSTASGLYSFSFGDTNFASSTSSIAFGSGNEVKGAAGFSAGAGNRVCDTYGVAFGNKAQSGGPLINGKCDPDSFNITGLAAVAIGYNVTADKDHTTALGKFASNNGFSGTFVWSDGSATASADTFKNTANNEFAARATGGFRFRTNLTGTTGCNLPAGSGVFNCTSSRYTKENFFAVNGEDVLNSLRKIPVTSWNYISEGQQVRHMGPMAEDFYKAFRLGTGNTSIGVQDLAGVSLAAVKALDQRTAELQSKVTEVEQLRAQVKTLEQRLNALEQNMQEGAPKHHAAKGRR
jgi:hypothetical protein